MITNISAPFAINIFALIAFFALSGFITSRILAAAPEISMSSHAVEAARAVTQADYAGIIAWVTAKEIKITDNFGVARAFDINDKTHILIKGFPADAATYKDLRVFDHVRVTALSDGNNNRAETILVQ